MLRAKVTRFLWHAITDHHKSTHLTPGPKIYQPVGFGVWGPYRDMQWSGGLLVTQALSRVWSSAWFYCSQQGNQTLQRPWVHISFHKESYKGINHFGDLWKTQSERGGREEVCCTDPKKTTKRGYVKWSWHRHILRSNLHCHSNSKLKKATYKDVAVAVLQRHEIHGLLYLRDHIKHVQRPRLFPCTWYTGCHCAK